MRDTPGTRAWMTPQQRIRHLELLHAVHCLERAGLQVEDDLQPLIVRVLEFTEEIVELSVEKKPVHEVVI